MQHARLQRLLELLIHLQDGPAHNTSTLATALGVSRRTVFRDLDMLRDAGVPLTFDGERLCYEFEGASILPPTSFTTQEALALILLCQELGDERGVPFLGPARSAALKVESSLPRRLRDHLRDVSQAISIQLAQTNPLDAHGSIYDTLLTAIARRRAVRIRYDSFTEWEEISTKLKPYRLLFSRRSWYAIGRSSLHRAVRTFNVGRIREISVLDEAYSPPSRFRLERYLRNAWHLIPEAGHDQEVLVRFQPLVAGNVAEVLWHRTQRVERRPDGTLDFRVTVSGLGEIAWWILGYGDQAEVLEPIELRRRVAQAAERMRARYEDVLDGDNAAALATTPATPGARRSGRPPAPHHRTVRRERRSSVRRGGLPG
jgi:proteasome accessory factor B